MVSWRANLATVRAGILEGTGTLDRAIPFTAIGTIASSSATASVFASAIKVSANATGQVNIHNLRLTLIYIPS